MDSKYSSMREMLGMHHNKVNYKAVNGDGVDEMFAKHLNAA